jgi:methyltransferase family protein
MEDVMDEKASPASRGQAVYTRSVLRMYDAMVYRVNGPILWRCPTDRLVELYDDHVSACHLDIGVGTGYLMDHCRFPVEDPEIMLMDMNANSLEFTARRLRRYKPRTHQGNVLTAWDLPDQHFHSVAMCNVLHCAPGTMREKGIAFGHARSALAPGGTLFGSTVLGEGVKHTRRSRLAMKRFNKRGIFCNLDDHLDDLDAALARYFTSHEIEIHGVLAFFTARREDEPS